MRLYHRTTSLNANNILVGGFSDGEGTYLTKQTWRGVWLSDRILDENEGAGGDAILEVTSNIDSGTLSFYEWKEEGKSYREWLVPAELLNKQSKIRLMGWSDWAGLFG